MVLFGKILFSMIGPSLATFYTYLTFKTSYQGGTKLCIEVSLLYAIPVLIGSTIVFRATVKTGEMPWILLALLCVTMAGEYYFRESILALGPYLIDLFLPYFFMWKAIEKAQIVNFEKWL